MGIQGDVGVPAGKVIQETPGGDFQFIAWRKAHPRFCDTGFLVVTLERQTADIAPKRGVLKNVVTALAFLLRQPHARPRYAHSLIVTRLQQQLPECKGLLIHVSLGGVSAGVSGRCGNQYLAVGIYHLGC